MIEASMIESLVSQYARYGWKLRKILVTTKIPKIDTHFPDVPTQRSDLDAAWFSRSNRNGKTWELRRLTGPPFALVRMVAENVSESELKQILRSAERQMKETPVKSGDEIPTEK